MKLLCTAGEMTVQELLHLFCNFVQPKKEQKEEDVFILFKVEDELAMNEIAKVLMAAEKSFNPDLCVDTHKLIVDEKDYLKLELQMITEGPFGLLWKISIDQEKSNVVFVKMLFERDIGLLNENLSQIFNFIKENHHPEKIPPE